MLPPPSIDTERSILASAVECGAGRFDGLLIPPIGFRDAQFYRDGHCFPLCKKGKLNGDIGFQNNPGPTRIRQRIDRFRSGAGLDGFATREPRHHVRGLGRSLLGSHLDLPGSLRAAVKPLAQACSSTRIQTWLGGSRSVSIIHYTAKEVVSRGQLGPELVHSKNSGIDLPSERPLSGCQSRDNFTKRAFPRTIRSTSLLARSC